MAAVKAELDGFYLGDSLLAFPVITGVTFNNSPFRTSYSNILGRGITVVALNLVLWREREAVQWGTKVGTAVCKRSVRWEQQRRET